MDKDESLFKEDTDSVDQRIKKPGRFLTGREDSMQGNPICLDGSFGDSFRRYDIPLNAIIWCSLIIGTLEGIALLLVARTMGLKDVSLMLNKLIDTVSPNSQPPQ